MGKKKIEDKPDTQVKENKPKKVRKPDIHVEFSDFVKNEVRRIIGDNIEMIRIAVENDTYEEMSEENWVNLVKMLNHIHEYEKDNDDYNFNPKRCKYTVTEQVLEKQRKTYIKNWLGRLNEIKDDEMEIYFHNMIYEHCRLLINETSRHEHKKVAEKKK